jgi:hypothetical protein
MVGVALLAAGCSTPVTRSTRAPTPQPTALLVSATNAPLRVLGSDAMEHLEYDLLLTNVFTSALTLTAIEVTGPDGRVLLRLAGDALAARMEPVFYPAPNASPNSRIPTGGMVAANIDLVVPPGAVPTRIGHRINYDLPPDTPALTLIASRAVAGPELTVDARLPMVIAPPLRGNGWLDGNGCCDAFSVHRSPRVVVDGARLVKPETFAIDWVRIDNGKLWAGDGTRNEQYFAFGAEVVAVAEGTVVSVRDDMPEETPRQPPAAVKGPGDYLGNHVVVQIRADVWAVYAHLQPGSTPVRAGERVATGQPDRPVGQQRQQHAGTSALPALRRSRCPDVDVLAIRIRPLHAGGHDRSRFVERCGERLACVAGAARRRHRGHADRHLSARVDRAGFSLTRTNPRYPCLTSSNTRFACRHTEQFLRQSARPWSLPLAAAADPIRHRNWRLPSRRCRWS